MVNPDTFDHFIKKPSMKKIFDVKHSKIDRIDTQKKHFKQILAEETQQRKLIKTFYPDGNHQSERESMINDLMGKKKRLDSVSAMRNGLPRINQGDKIYNNPECSHNFYKEGGLIPGSTNKINYKKTVGKKADTFYDTLDLNIKTLDPTKMWNYKEYNSDLKSQRDYVKNLDNWENNVLKEILAKNDKNKEKEKIVNSNNQKKIDKNIKQTNLRNRK